MEESEARIMIRIQGERNLVCSQITKRMRPRFSAGSQSLTKTRDGCVAGNQRLECVLDWKLGAEEWQGHG